jgi:SAM-dependent methyltransferase
MGASIPIEQIKQSMRAAWMAGDFGMLAKRTSADAEAFVSRLAFPPGTRVLDVACGTGNLAIPLARTGAIVTGVDIAPNLLEQARKRAVDEGLPAQFDEGDAEQLPYSDSAFDAVVTMFGAMFAPRPQMVAAEFARVLRPDGWLAMANWSPGSFTGEMFKVSSRHVPPPPDIAPPILWGDDAAVRERLGQVFRDVETEMIAMDFDCPTNPAGAVEFFRTYFGPTRVAFERLDSSGRAALAADLVSLWSSANVAPDPDQHTLIHNEYLKVTAVRR